MGVKHLLLPSQLPGTHLVMICMIRRLALTVSDVCLKLGCFQSTSTHSALEVQHFMRYIDLQLYLIPYYVQSQIHKSVINRAVEALVTVTEICVHQD